MDTKRARMMAVDLMTHHGLQGWAFTFDSARWRHGLCSYRKKQISLSKRITELNTEETVLDTILHEIAHALSPKRGHGPVWKAKAVEIGCSGERCASKDTIKVPAPFEGECPKCGHVIKAFRRRKSACKACCVKYNNGVYYAPYLFEWRKI